MSVTQEVIEEAPVLVEKAGGLGRIRLNRPKALNSLTLDMVRSISAALDDFARDTRIAVVLLTGEGERGFCAGGDIRALYDSGRAGTDLCETFWREEYVLDARIKHFPKPYVAVMDGITMGGGVGLSAHGRYRIVTERTRLAMPETGIGFFPDVGSTWLLSRGPGETGTYLGLTGEPIGASDAIRAGLADLFVPVSALSRLAEALETQVAGDDSDCVWDTLKQFALPAEPAPLQENASEIDRVFASGTVEEILASLAKSATEFAHKTRTVLLTKSPTSLKITLRLLRLARSSTSLEQCLEREFAAGRKVIRGHDFYEGVRAAVIDKDRRPRWSPTDLSEVSDSDIEAYLITALEPVFPARPSA